MAGKASAHECERRARGGYIESQQRRPIGGMGMVGIGAVAAQNLAVCGSRLPASIIIPAIRGVAGAKYAPPIPKAKYVALKACNRPSSEAVAERAASCHGAEI